ILRPGPPLKRSGPIDPWVFKILGSSRSLGLQDPWVFKILGSSRSLGLQDPWVFKILGSSRSLVLRWNPGVDDLDPLATPSGVAGFVESGRSSASSGFQTGPLRGGPVYYFRDHEYHEAPEYAFGCPGAT